MPHWEESIKGDREAVRIQRELAIKLGEERAQLAIDTMLKQSYEDKWKGDLRKFLACCLMALAGLGFAVLVMLVARYH